MPSDGGRAMIAGSAEQGHLSPLPEDVIRAIESKQWLEHLSIIVRNNNILDVEADKLQGGFTVLDDFPERDSDMFPFREAIYLCFIRGRNLATKVANSADLKVKHIALHEEFFPCLCHKLCGVDDELGSRLSKHESELSGTEDSDVAASAAAAISACEEGRAIE